MISRRHNPKAPRGWLPASPLSAVIAAVCIFLILLVGAAHLLHVHPADAPSEGNCSLCLVAHLAASPAPVVAGPAIDAVLRAMPPPEPVLAAADSTVLAFHIRPPPVL